MQNVFLKSGITLIVFCLGFLSMYTFCNLDIATKFSMSNEEFVCGILFRIFLTFFVWIVCLMIGDKLTEYK